MGKHPSNRDQQTCALYTKKLRFNCHCSWLYTLLITGFLICRIANSPAKVNELSVVLLERDSIPQAGDQQTYPLYAN